MSYSFAPFILLSYQLLINAFHVIFPFYTLVLNLCHKKIKYELFKLNLNAQRIPVCLFVYFWVGWFVDSLVGSGVTPGSEVD